MGIPPTARLMPDETMQLNYFRASQLRSIKEIKLILRQLLYLVLVYFML
jgi:hypothetical protein